jgi:hypothetical protein
MKRKCQHCDGTGEIIARELDVYSADGKINRGRMTIVNFNPTGTMLAEALPAGMTVGDRIATPEFPMLYRTVRTVDHTFYEFTITL